MKKTFLMMLFPVLLLIVFLQFNTITPPEDRLTMTVEEASLIPSTSFKVTFKKARDISPVLKEPTDEKYVNATGKNAEIVKYALSLIGSPYLYGGTSRNGFDCSGFITHVFEAHGVAIKRSSSLQATEGKEITRSEAAPGDLVIFTGTDKTKRTPGHVGIVISEPGDTIKFVHSSSARRESGVKISQVEGSGYDERFMAIRRVL